MTGRFFYFVQVMHLLVESKASALQYLLPFIFCLGALVSIIGRLKRGELLSSVAKSHTPASLDNMSWREFELLVGEAYRQKGFTVIETGQGGKDGGVDLVLTLPGNKTLVQCKQWKTYKVGVKIVRELFGVMTAEQATAGVVVTSGKFTKDAIAFADGKNIDLVDGAKLFRMIKLAKSSINKRSDVHTNSTPPIASVDTDVVSNLAPSCPRCGKVMVERVAKKGSYAGNKFWGCSSFPVCRGVLNK